MTRHRPATGDGIVDVLDHVLGKGIVIERVGARLLGGIDLISGRTGRRRAHPNLPRLRASDSTSRGGGTPDQDLTDSRQAPIGRTVPGRRDLTEALALASNRANILIERPSTRQAGAALAMLLPHRAGPLLAWSDDTALPVNERATLLVTDVDCLTQDQQAQLLLWLDANQPRVQVIAISASPLFPLVQRGAFSEALFDRLNIVRVGDTHDVGLPNEK